MAYVKANTAPMFGSRAQSVSALAQRLGAYMRASFPLPTTSMSQPVSTRLGLGNPSPGGIFWDGPYPAYGQPETSATRATALSGEWIPPAPPGPLPFDRGALTYRIDPQTGQYKFSVTDITPRGVWQQNVFQPPVKPALSALGVRMTGCGCKSRGCKCKGLGDTSNACTLDSDCGGGYCDTVNWVCLPGPPAPGGPSLAVPPKSSWGTALQQVINAVAPRTPTVPAAPSAAGGILSGSTNILGLSIPNPVLFGGVALVAMGIASGGRRR